MTYPGAPGGYPGPGQPQQPPQQPQPGFGPPPVGSRFTLAQTLHLVVIGLGALNLFLGFAPVVTSTSFYEGLAGWVPGLLFAGGLLALPAVLPGDKKVGPGSVAVVLSTTLAFLFTVFTIPAELKAGGIMVLIFALLQAIGAIAAFLFEAGVLKPPAPRQHHGHFGQPGGYNPNPASGQFQQPYGQPPVQQQPGAQTTFAPQQGQFGQPPHAPGTPPGGYPQQG
ncbi:DUF5336 domain-containing protein [Actinokineospora globicatena]|uniref:Uncharacterized protein n=1 Tax=Actinokineospora globicatena TaxID=103729 RepID=A0A9W6QTT1_9PSEU|nr:DUF5336 domain-containing protein [Actinokineospora globicatena]MCP2301959.1 hypothetical protein [Actinokineospora globicatena]GLW76381.1 hypothetical protein Aglo01_08630 [Actinokineospora globicatena]GLW83216.1 hypothetical protein Aglo02_08560 [Actinokineospora globicatena]GLW94813.1 hypothetical protein Aglo03_56290 [Actinokineospora globicatena]